MYVSIFSDDNEIKSDPNKTSLADCINVIDKDEFQEAPVIRW